MRNDKPGKPRMTKPIYVPQRKEETQSKLRVFDSQRFDDQINLILVQSREHSFEVIPTKKASQAQAVQT